MKNNIHIFILFQLFGCLVFAQEVEMNGITIDAKTKKPIEFVNIGILNKNQGTISNLNGEFNLKISKEFQNDSLTVSHINYYSVKIPIMDIKNQTISLEPKVTELFEVIVSNKKKINRKIGIKSYSRLLSMRVVSKDNDVVEVAQRINIPDKEVWIKTVNFNLRKWSKVDGVRARINFYKNVNNAPGEKIVFKNIIRKMPLEIGSGWIQIDLSDYNIYVSEDFFVGIEFIPNFENSTVIDLGSVISKGKGYLRENSLGTWEKLGGAASINAEIEY